MAKNFGEFAESNKLYVRIHAVISGIGVRRRKAFMSHNYKRLVFNEVQLWLLWAFLPQ